MRKRYIALTLLLTGLLASSAALHGQTLLPKNDPNNPESTQSPGGTPNPGGTPSTGIATKIVQDGDYWRLCDDSIKRCFPIVPVYTMAGLNPTLITARDGKTPLVTFTLLPNTTRSPDELSASIDSFMAQFDGSGEAFLGAYRQTAQVKRVHTDNQRTQGRTRRTNRTKP
jgi:hypothetical protein